MGHEMHLMEGFILDSIPHGESGRILKLLTRDHGIMSVTAVGVRELKSKMRGSMDILQLVNFEYVEGREINRLTGIHEKEKYSEIFMDVKNVIQKRRVISNVVNFVQRTVVGDTGNDRLWDSFLEGMNLLKTQNDKFKEFEILWLIKILVSLGYWEEGRLDSFSDESYKTLTDEAKRAEIVEEINSTIRSTHL